MGATTSAEPGAAPGAKAIDDRSREGKGLARPGRRLDKDVEAGESVADHELLNGKGLCDASLSEDIADGRRDAEVREGLVRHVGAAFFAALCRGVIRESSTCDPNRTSCAPELSETSRVRVTRTAEA